jgi:hypothetical protein
MTPVSTPVWAFNPVLAPNSTGTWTQIALGDALQRIETLLGEPNAIAPLAVGQREGRPSGREEMLVDHKKCVRCGAEQVPGCPITVVLELRF